ncbi:hypothetical protein BBK82_47145 [Lentzea guizhouensis]|uniref:Uncharacterized protein n=1 Tax=Lentzea guizhouensis TaxID=1586287 RepID=A0A1B2HXF4_9PSEU|nr:hypothetical protein BBK82_47145 [Lentzea guizhouensis]
MMCAFVPEMPNEETPALRARGTEGHGVFDVSNDTDPAVQSTCDEGAVTCKVRGNNPCRNAMTILITPAAPAAACVCPMFDLIDPSNSGSARSCP